MDSLLSYAYLEESCPHCRDVVPVTLYEILLEQQIQREWQPVRRCEGCAEPRGHAVNAIPEVELDRLAAAWDALRVALAARGVRLHVGAWQPATHHRSGRRQTL
jgi:hypothetical protein